MEGGVIVKRNSKRGFTLVEMMLAIAITLIISGFFVTLLVSIRSSYYRTYNDDDCADIAALYAEALENTILYDVQNGITDDEIKIDPATSILVNSKHTITFPAGFNNADVNQKWEIRMLCAFNDRTGEFQYSFYFIDRYVQPGYLHYVYQGSFWIPTYVEFVPRTVGNGDEVAPGETNSWDYNYSRSTVNHECHPVISPATTVDENGIIGPSSLYTTTVNFGGEDIEVHSRMSTDSRGNIGGVGDVVSVPDLDSCSVITIAAGVSDAPGGGTHGGGAGTGTPTTSPSITTTTNPADEEGSGGLGGLTPTDTPSGTPSETPSASPTPQFHDVDGSSESSVNSTSTSGSHWDGSLDRGYDEWGNHLVGGTVADTTSTINLDFGSSHPVQSVTIRISGNNATITHNQLDWRYRWTDNGDGTYTISYNANAYNTSNGPITSLNDACRVTVDGTTAATVEVVGYTYVT